MKHLKFIVPLAPLVVRVGCLIAGARPEPTRSALAADQHVGAGVFIAAA